MARPARRRSCIKSRGCDCSRCRSGTQWQSMPINCCSRCVTRALGSANSIRSVRIPQRGHRTRRWCTPQPPDGPPRADRARSAPSYRAPGSVRRPHPLHVYRRIPRRSTRIRSAPSDASPSLNTSITRNPGRPRIQVHSHRKCGPRRRPGISSDRCIQIGEQPIFTYLPEAKYPDHPALRDFRKIAGRGGVYPRLHRSGVLPPARNHGNVLLSVHHERGRRGINP